MYVCVFSLVLQICVIEIQTEKKPIIIIFGPA